MESPTLRIDGAGNQPVPLTPRGTRCLRGANKPKCWCQPQSRAVSLVNFIADLFPRSVLEFIRQSFAAKSDERRKFFGFAFLLFQNQTKAVFGEGAKSGFFFPSHALRAFKKIVGDFNGRLHNMAAHIRMDGCPYQELFPNRELILFITA